MKTPEEMAEEYCDQFSWNDPREEDAHDAFLAGYKAAENHFRDATEKVGPQWISVNDRLPKWHKDVLAYTVFCSFREIKVVRHEPNYGFDFKGIVTHWMELPEPPKEEK